MRSRTLLSSLFAVVVLAGCVMTPEQEGGSKPTLRKPAPSAPVGEDNDNGEHGENAPAGPTDAPELGAEVGSETWADGKAIDSNITIAEGATVEIAPGATVTVAANAAITVKGTLKVAAAAKHAKLTGASWTGLVIASGGTLDATGLEIENAALGLWTQENAAATFTSGVIRAASPFKMKPGSTLTVSKTSVTATAGSAIAGTFRASYMVYDKGTAGGLTLNDPAGTMVISDSELKGAGGGDFVISSAGKSLKLEYTTITGSHCGLHFEAIDQFTLDHVSDDQNSYGAMLYGSGAGPHAILSSNVRSTDVDLHMKGNNGPLTISKSYTGGKNALAANAVESDAARAPIPDAKPRQQL